MLLTTSINRNRGALCIYFLQGCAVVCVTRPRGKSMTLCLAVLCAACIFEIRLHRFHNRHAETVGELAHPFLLWALAGCGCLTSFPCHCIEIKSLGTKHLWTFSVARFKDTVVLRAVLLGFIPETLSFLTLVSARVRPTNHFTHMSKEHVGV